MRTLLFTIMLSILSSTTAIAQEQDPWVGTWTSESYRGWDWDDDSDDPVYTDYKLVIRITKNGEEYSVRAKTIMVKNPNRTLYHNPLTLQRMTENTIWLESYVKKSPFTVDYGTGPYIKSYFDYTYFYKITLENGTLHYSHYKVYSIEYDRNMNYKSEDTMNVSDMRGNNLDLFNDDW